jgi:hypothetical protein
MMFLVTGPKGRIDCQAFPVEAPTADDAAIGAGTQLDLEITGRVSTLDFRDPRSSREYEFVRHVKDRSDELVHFKVEPTVVLQVGKVKR